MITHLAIAKRFKAGADMETIAWYLRHHFRGGMSDAKQYVENAIREVLKRHNAGRQRWTT